VSVATNSSAEEIGGAMADLFEKFDIKSVEDMEGAMAGLAVQGKRGSFELRDAAAQFPALAAAAQGLGIGKGKDALLKLGGLTQIARRGTGSAEQASTALQNVFGTLATKQGALKKTGVNVFDKNGQARDINDLLVDVISKAGGDDLGKKTGALAKIFGKQGIRAINPMLDVYKQGGAIRNEAGELTGFDSAKAAQALRDELDNAANSAGALAEIDADLAAQQEKSSSQLTAAWEQLRVSVQPMVPVVTGMIGAISSIPWDSVASGVASFAEMLSVAGDTLRNWAKEVGLISGDGNEDPAKVIARGQQELGDIERRRNNIQARLDPIIGKFGSNPTQADLEGEGVANQYKADVAKIRELNAEQGRVEAQMGRARAEQDRRGQVGAQALSVDDFVDQTVALARPGTELETKVKARQVAAKIQAGESYEGFMNPEQQRLTQAFSDTVQFNRTRRDGKVEGAQATNAEGLINLNDSLASMTQALQEKAAEIRGVNVSGGGTAFHE